LSIWREWISGMDIDTGFGVWGLGLGFGVGFGGWVWGLGLGFKKKKTVPAFLIEANTDCIVIERGFARIILWLILNIMKVIWVLLPN
jgi:hypothetical protein